MMEAGQLNRTILTHFKWRNYLCINWVKPYYIYIYINNQVKITDLVGVVRCATDHLTYPARTAFLRAHSRAPLTAGPIFSLAGRVYRVARWLVVLVARSSAGATRAATVFTSPDIVFTASGDLAGNSSLRGVLLWRSFLPFPLAQPNRCNEMAYRHLVYRRLHN